MNTILRNIIFPLMVFSSLILVSCSDNDDNRENYGNLTFIDNLPNALNVKSTSAYIPLYDEGSFEIRYTMRNPEDQHISPYQIYKYTSQILSTYMSEGPYGFDLWGLEPDTTYYYTLVYMEGNKKVFSHQVKSFTTKGVSVEFIEPQTSSFGNLIGKALCVKTSDIDERELPVNLLVKFYMWPQDRPSYILWPTVKYVGDNIWKDDNLLEEGYCYQAVVKTHSGRTVAKTPVVLWTNGTMVELHE